MASGSSNANEDLFVMDNSDEEMPISFKKIFAELQSYREANNGSLAIPRSHPTMSKILDSLASNCIEPLIDERWNDQLAALTEYVEDEGHCRVPFTHPTLGEWMEDQKEHYLRYEERRPNMLTEKRYKKLKEVGLNFDKNRWDVRFEELKAYKEKNGNSEPPIDYPHLGIWVLNQRFNLHEMPQARIDALDSIGFNWNPNRLKSQSRDKTWDAQFKRLQQFIAEKGHPNVPKANGGLSAWVRKQRYEYAQLKKKKPSSLTPYRIEKLESVGFNWRLRPNAVSWEERFEQLCNHKEEHGHFNGCKSIPGLGSWVAYQRVQCRLYMKGMPSNVDQTKVDKLNTIGFFDEDDNQKEKQKQEAVEVGRYHYYPGSAYTNVQNTRVSPLETGASPHYYLNVPDGS